MSADVSAVQRSKGSSPTVWLEVTYDGTRPPIGLFADLEMIGWRPPVPASPPASALDWTTPDPDTGSPCTIRPWTVAGAVVEPPPGTGPRQHWTEAERTVLVATLEGVLRRHGLLEPSDEPLDASPELALRPPPPPDPARTPDPDPGDPSPRPFPATPAGTRVARPAAASTVVVRAPITPVSLRDRVSDAVAPLGVTSHIGTTTRTATRSYRRSTYEVEVEVLEIEVLCDPSLVEVVSAVLRDLGLDPTIAGAPVSDGADRNAPGPSRATTADPPANRPLDVTDQNPAPVVEPAGPAPQGNAVVAVVVEPGSVDRALALLASHATGPARTEPTAIRTVGTYRGSTFETETAAVRVTCPVPAAAADEVAAATAGALGIRLGDPARVQVVPVPIDLHEPSEPTTHPPQRVPDDVLER